ncbi:response regulator [Myxococcota bacterium]|nr:response regulator [Myxococcota bacterium]MBU1380968.1 response regulator [Myxococcota bacterium]MBU1497090.1 response regulator [Myxococcota bacterium]
MSDDDDFIVFEEESDEKIDTTFVPWIVLLVDDDPQVHTVTELVLKSFSYKGRTLEFLHAYSGSQAEEILTQNPDIAVIFLDVVMEHSHAGLDLVNWIRTTANNQLVRIILRTGQPGEAPENSVMINYDINDYREKTELSAQRLITSLIAALRSWEALNQLDELNNQLEEKVRLRTQELQARTRELEQNYDFLVKKDKFAKYISSLFQIGMIVYEKSSSNIVYINSIVENIFKISKTDAYSRTINDFLHFTSTGRYSQNQEKESELEESFIVLPDHTKVPVIISHKCDFFGNSDLCGYIFLDISSQKALEHLALNKQKLEAIGQLASGIAHELNTPSQYIQDNLEFLKSSFKDLTDYISQGDTLISEKKDELNNILDRIEALKNQFDVSYLLSEIPEALGQSLDGINKISTIVKAMKQFAHPESQMEDRIIDIGRILDDAITITKNEWKYNCTINQDLSEPAGSLMGAPNELCQVFINMIVNSVQSINSCPDGRKGIISIQSENSTNFYIISIKDNGGGIPSEIISKIYDPFFTTKPPGDGSGQGLAIAYSIITSRHKGKVEVKSDPGNWCEFKISLPFSN